MSGTDQQPVVFPGKEAIGVNTFCVKKDEGHIFNVKQFDSCDSQVNSELNTFCIDEDESYTFNEIQCESQECSELKTLCRDENKCNTFSINQCESHANSGLDTIYLYIDSRDSRKLKFLIDTGAEISIIRSSSLIPGVEYDWHKRMEIKGISNTIMKTLGKIKLKLFTDTHETTHTFNVLRGNF
jgi:hypothetical protein